MALILRAANDRISARAASRLASVGLGAQVAVVAGRAVWSLRVTATARSGIANPGIVALVEGRANHGVGAGAAARLASVRLGAKIAVVTSGPVNHRVVLAFTRYTKVGSAGVAVFALGVRDTLHAPGVVHVHECIAIIVPTVSTGRIEIGTFRLSRIDETAVVVAVIASGTATVQEGVAVGILVGDTRDATSSLTSVRLGT
jgi:hypothetical protein